MRPTTPLHFGSDFFFHYYFLKQTEIQELLLSKHYYYAIYNKHTHKQIPYYLYIQYMT